MKYSICLLAIVIVFSACNKKTDVEPVLPEDYLGEASAEQNGALWTAHPACSIDNVDKTNISIHLDSFLKGTRLYYLKESLYISKIPPIPGTYNVGKAGIGVTDVNSRFSFWDYDETLGIYNILESDSATNRVTLASYDTLTNEIKGSFNLTFIVVTRPYPYTPDTIRFKNGKVHGKLVKK